MKSNLGTFLKEKLLEAQHEKYKDSVYKKGGRIVYLMDKDPQWHKDLNQTFRKLDRQDFSEDFESPKIDHKEMYNTNNKFEELTRKLDILENKHFEPES